MRLLVTACLVLVASTASAQVSKPVGVFDGGHNPPTWAQFATLSDLDPPHVWAEAKALSVTRGTIWWLKIGYHEDPRVPVGPHAARVRQRLDAYGLLPYIGGMTVLMEEAYGYWKNGDLRHLNFPPDYPGGEKVIRDWLGFQIAEAKKHIPVPAIWITPIATKWDGPMPVPATADIVALDPYIFAGGTFQSDVEPWLWLAEESVSQPLLLIAQWFDQPGFAPPDPANVPRYLHWLSRPRWMALAAFTWLDRPWLNMRGLSSLTTLRQTVESSLGAR